MRNITQKIAILVQGIASWKSVSLFYTAELQSGLLGLMFSLEIKVILYWLFLYVLKEDRLCLSAY